MTTANPRRVCIESPLRGDVARNVAYADACMLHALQRGDAPFLGHLLYPRVLDDALPEDRDLGISGHVAWLTVAEAVVVYLDYGVTAGMEHAIELARTLHIPVEYRQLGDGWLDRFRSHAQPTAGMFHDQRFDVPKP